MKTIGKLAVAVAIALASATGAVTASTAATTLSSAAPPWHADTAYYTAGVLTGTTRYYCDGRIRDTGDVFNYDTSVHVVYYECP
jgi:hypothetical protein